jgi:cysteine desulfurase
MMIYLDNHATTMLDPRVLEAMIPWLTDRYGNAGSATHAMGRDARDAVEDSRARMAAAVGADLREILFTSGATEAINLALQGAAARRDRPGRILAPATEHPAVLDTLDHLGRRGHTITLLPVMPQSSPGMAGRIDPAVIDLAWDDETFLASVLLANNEIGVVQDVRAIADVVHRSGGLLHVDCTQALGRMPVDVDALGADLASFSAHKFHGPKGVGALWVRRRGRPVRIDPLVFGGGQERGLRSGTHDVPGIVGMAAAAELAVAGLADDVPRIRRLRDRLMEKLSAGIDGLALNGPPLDSILADGTPARLVNNLNVRVPGVDGQTLLATLDADDLAVSSGSACSSEQPRPSHVLLALGLDADQARASLRFGLSRFSSAAEIDAAAGGIVRGVAALRGMGGAGRKP